MYKNVSKPSVNYKNEDEFGSSDKVYTTVLDQIDSELIYR